MSKSIVGKWGYSIDGGQNFLGRYNIKEEAIEALKKESNSTGGYVGQYRNPMMPWESIYGWDLYEDLGEEEDYSFDFCDYFFYTFRDKRDELEAVLRKAAKKWFEDNNLIPDWGVVEYKTTEEIDFD